MNHASNLELSFKGIPLCFEPNLGDKQIIENLSAITRETPVINKRLSFDSCYWQFLFVKNGLHLQFESSQDQEPSLKKLMVSALPEFELKHKALTQWSKNDVSHFYANSNQTIVSLGSLLLASHEGLGFDFNRQRLLQKLILFSA